MGKVRKLPHLGLIPAAATLLIMAAWLAPASSAHGAPNIQATPTPAAGVPPCAPVAEFDPGNFSDSTNIDNEWLPLVPGNKLVLKGLVDGRHRRVVFIATDLTKVINGVRTIVMWNRDYQSGRLAESELAFFAQDDDGNVWNLGKYAEEYENGQFTGAPNTWIAGIADAEGGVHMPGEPEAGGPEYAQGFAPEIDFLDCAKVISKDEGDPLCVPLDCYDHILITEETSPLDAGSGHQRKYHAKDLGIVQITAVENPGETLALIRNVELGDNEKLWARQRALALEDRAYEISDVYKDTPPAELVIDPPVATPTPSPEPTEPPRSRPSRRPNRRSRRPNPPNRPRRRRPLRQHQPRSSLLFARSLLSLWPPSRHQSAAIWRRFLAVYPAGLGRPARYCLKPHRLDAARPGFSAAGGIRPYLPALRRREEPKRSGTGSQD